MDVTLTTSDEITLVSIVTTLVSLAWAIYERMKANDAKEQVRRFRNLLLKQQIAQQFSDVPERAVKLVKSVRMKEWDQSAEVGFLLSSDLASLNGVHSDLVKDSNRTHLDTALTVMREINQNLPRGQTDSSPEIESRLVDACNGILVLVNTIERSLRIEAALGGE